MVTRSTNADDAALEPFLDRLYAAPFGAFTDVRKSLVQELRARGDRAAADALAAVKRPTRSAWALNQVARRHPDELAAFVAAAEGVRDAQRRAIERRDAGGVGEAGRAMSAAASSVVALAARAIAEDGASATAAVERAIGATLRALPFASPEDADRLRRGALAGDLEPPEDFTIFGAATAGASHVSTAEAKQRDEERPDPRAVQAAKRKERQEALRARAEAERRERAIAKLQQAADEAEREVTKLERVAEAAAERARRAEEEARGARRSAEQARAAVEAARRG